ncbi:MAG: glycosyltransferase family 4 protein, partial [Gemmatimonadetes bacterium]|nr:glycosyltransferase family 4 protein [Gemmatimonadota bacterium]
MSTIGIDARKIRDFGIGRYLAGLLEGLAELPGPERYVLFLPPDPERALPADLSRRLAPERFERVTVSAPLYSWRELFAFRDLPARHGLAVVHFPHYVRPFVRNARVTVTVHDLIHLDWAPSMPARVYASRMLRRGARADRVLTVSDAVRTDLGRRLGVPGERIHVAPNAVSATFRPPDSADVERFRRERGVSPDAVLLVASHRPHKNLGGGVDAWRLAGAHGPLLVPARDDDAAARLRPALEGTGATILRDVADRDLPLLFAAVRAVLVPSLAEGFGLVPLEAAACGACVVAYALPAHREGVGDAALLAEELTPES